MKYQKEIDLAKLNYKKTEKTFNYLAKGNRKKLDDVFQKEHELAFRKIDCLSCANCCKTTSPIFRDVDIKRISKKLNLSISAFITTYLKMDEEQDYVLQRSPCSFLNTDNTCQIYDIRPLACREYPHTDRKNIYQILDKTLLNSVICPAVAVIVEKIENLNKI